MQKPPHVDYKYDRKFVVMCVVDFVFVNDGVLAFPQCHDTAMGGARSRSRGAPDLPMAPEAGAAKTQVTRWMPQIPSGKCGVRLTPCIPTASDQRAPAAAMASCRQITWITRFGFHPLFEVPGHDANEVAIMPEDRSEFS